MKSDPNNIFIRNLSDIDKATLTELRDHFVESTNSRTVLKCLRTYKQMLEKLAAYENMNNTLQEENNNLRKKIDNLRNSLKDIQL